MGRTPKKAVTKVKKEPRSGYSDRVDGWSTSQYWSFIRSGLRAKWVRYPPRYEALANAKRPSQSDNKKLKWEFKCSICTNYFPQKEVEVNHKKPCGSLLSFADLEGFVDRLFCKASGLEVTCKACHLIETNGGRR